MSAPRWLHYHDFGQQACRTNLAGLYTLVASCEAVAVNALEYLTDLLIRIQTYPDDRIDELLSCSWKPPPQATAA